MWTRALLIVTLFLALGAFACVPEAPAPDAAVGGSAGPPAPPAGDVAVGPAPVDADLNLGLFSPVLPGIGLDTHSTECDPFGDDSEICL